MSIHLRHVRENIIFFYFERKDIFIYEKVLCDVICMKTHKKLKILKRMLFTKFFCLLR